MFIVLPFQISFLHGDIFPIGDLSVTYFQPINLFITGKSLEPFLRSGLQSSKQANKPV